MLADAPRALSLIAGAVGGAAVGLGFAAVNLVFMYGWASFMAAMGMEPSVGLWVDLLALCSGILTFTYCWVVTGLLDDWALGWA